MLLYQVNPLRGTVLVAVALLLAGCGGKVEPKRVPDVRGQRLDVAEERLDAVGLEWEELGGGTLGIIVRSNWYVCAQEPRPGKRATTVRLVVERSCGEFAAFVPGVVGLSLDEAEEELDAFGLPYVVEPQEDGTPRIEHLWTVCYQSPPAGQRATSVRLYVSRFGCD